MAQNSDKTQLFLQIFEHIFASRELDILEQDFTQRGEAFFHVSGGGHENIAFLYPHLVSEDYLHCHYRDKSLMIARGVSVKQFFLSLFCKDQSHSRGRQMSAHISDPENHVLSIVGPVGNSALQAAGVAATIKNRKGKPIVLCGLGDGMSQQGEVLEAVAHAVRETLPVLFVIEDNTFAISTKTKGRTFYSTPDGELDEFYGIPVVRVDGRDPEATYDTFGTVVAKMRSDRKPAIVIFQVARLNNHTNADDQRTYRSAEEIDATRKSSDPVPLLEKWLVNKGVNAKDLESIKARIHESVARDAIEAQDSPDPQPVYTAKIDLPARLTNTALEFRGDADGDQITMLEAIREVLRHRLASDERVHLFGEDIEDPKGDVFGVTKGLTKEFPGRVKNSPLAESSIVGVSVGQALAGDRPVAFLQFADFFPIAWNQVVSELGSMHWRTDGGWESPVIIMASCGGFKPGLGPFHASSFESVAAHTPGVDVYMPSTAGDAAGLLNAAFESNRPAVFFYPKSLLNDRTQATSRDVTKHLVPIGKARVRRLGDQLSFVGWGNTLPLIEKAANALEKVGVSVDVIDLRSLSPWDEAAVLASVRKTHRLIVVQEENTSVSLASEILAVVAEKANTQVACRRVARPDTFVPCNFGNQLDVLPSYKRILEEAVHMLEGTITWKADDKVEAGFAYVEAVGSSPSDESVTVVEWKVKVGDQLKPGMPLGEMEADKAAFDMSCPIAGIVAEILVPVGDMVKVGTPMLKVSVSAGRLSKKPLTHENPGTPIIEIQSPKKSVMQRIVDSTVETVVKPFRHNGAKENGAIDPLLDVAVAGIAGVSAAPGTRIVTNEEISKLCPAWDAEDIFKRVGIETRHWASKEEDALVLGHRAASDLLRKLGLSVDDLTAVICSTGSPVLMSPSLACLILDKLCGSASERPLIPAWDISAACSGYLYALQAAWDHLADNQNGMVLVVTSEVLSRRVDPADEATAPIFGDAATATLLVGGVHHEMMKAVVDRPVLASKAESGDSLRYPLEFSGEHIYMDGPKVFQAAVSNMALLLDKACAQSGVKASDLDLVVPHQANQRILNAVRQKARLPEGRVYSNIRHFGNTSSSSIPLALETILGERDRKSAPMSLGIVAFGAGFTFGGGIMHLPAGR